jgi:NAD-dependent deacetylase
VIAGAGISAESGVPTFRGKDGSWRTLDPVELATEAASLRDLALVWDGCRERRERIRRSLPNAGHRSLLKLQTDCDEFLLVTQNTDDLDPRAGMLPGRLVQIHGDIFVTRCPRCAFGRREPDQEAPGVPECPRCGGLTRPGVVWFDEELDPREVERVEMFLSRGPCEAVVVVGTQGTFDYIVSWALRARGPGGRLIEVNPEASALSPHATEAIREPAASALPRLVERLTKGPAIRGG